MKTIANNNELINILSGNLSLVSSKLHRINIHHSATTGLSIELYIELLYAKADKNIKLVFSGIEEYSFHYHQEYYFYNIERYKFFKKNNHFYISLDPYTEDDVISPEDQDFILSTGIEGYYI